MQPKPGYHLNCIHQDDRLTHQLTDTEGKWYWFANQARGQKKIFLPRHYFKRCTALEFYNRICGYENSQHCAINQILDM